MEPTDQFLAYSKREGAREEAKHNGKTVLFSNIGLARTSLSYRPCGAPGTDPGELDIFWEHQEVLSRAQCSSEDTQGINAWCALWLFPENQFRLYLFLSWQLSMSTSGTFEYSDLKASKETKTFLSHLSYKEICFLYLFLYVLQLLLQFLYISIDIGVVLVLLQNWNVSTCYGTQKKGTLWWNP